MRFWKDIPLRLKAAILIGLPIIGLTATGLMVLSNASLHENEAQLWVDHTLAVRGKLGTILDKLLAAEAWTRSAVLSRQSDAGTRLTAVRAEIEQEIDSLEKMVRDNPGQRDQIGLLRALSSEKFDALEALLKTTAQGPGRGDPRFGPK